MLPILENLLYKAGKVSGVLTLGLLAEKAIDPNAELNAGDYLSGAAAIATFIPGLAPLGVLLTGASVAWSLFATSQEQYGKLNRSGQYHVYDPLALDLDGDGIETVAAKGFQAACSTTTATASAPPPAGFLPMTVCLCAI